jgi:hypothetical protein
MVKQNAAESQARYSIVVDPSGYLWSSEQVFEKMCSLVATLAEDLFLAGDLDYCKLVGRTTIKISRVADLESFFDSIAALELDAKAEQSRDPAYSNAISFTQIDGNSVGATINGITIAKA